MSLTAQITSDLYEHLMRKTNPRACLNSWVPGRWEMDMACVTKDGYLKEYEIKISRSDFLADKKKKKNKHVLYESMKSARAQQKAYWTRIVPSMFYYVCPPDLIKKEELPNFAGLIYMDSRPEASSFHKFHVIKKAPKLHNLLMSEKDMGKLYHCMSWRLSTMLKKAGYDS